MLSETFMQYIFIFFYIFTLVLKVHTTKFYCFFFVKFNSSNIINYTLITSLYFMNNNVHIILILLTGIN